MTLSAQLVHAEIHVKIFSAMTLMSVELLRFLAKVNTAHPSQLAFLKSKVNVRSLCHQQEKTWKTFVAMSVDLTTTALDPRNVVQTDAELSVLVRSTLKLN
jgi:hypothetical protein